MGFLRMNYTKKKNIQVTFFIYLTFFIISSGVAYSASKFETMEDSTFRVLCTSNPLISNKISLGSGFLVSEGKYFVTNWHVAACIEEGGYIEILFGSDNNKEIIKAKVIGKSKQKDLAILKIEK